MHESRGGVLCSDNRASQNGPITLTLVDGVTAAPASLAGGNDGVAAAPATATIVLSVSTQQSQAKPLYIANARITLDGFTTSFPTPVATAVGVANALAAALNVAASPVTATVVSGGTASSASVAIVTKATGASQNGPIALTLVNGVTAAPASLAGGNDGVAASPATATIALSAATQQSQAKPLYIANARITLDGFTASFPTPVATAVGVANALAAALNVAASPVTATVASGGTASSASVAVVTKAAGSSQNGPITLTLVDGVTAAPASLAGGVDAGGTVYDAGSVTANVNGSDVSVAYGEDSTAQALAESLASAINAAGTSVTASADSSGTVSLTATQAGTAGNGVAIGITVSSSESVYFPTASFAGGSTTLSGGEDGSSSPGTIYSYAVPASTATTGYASNGNLLYYTDSVTGGWTMTYDALNRLTTAEVASGPWASLNMGWSYDAFGNRTSQTLSGNPQAPAPQSQAWDYTASSRNQATTIGYDAAGNVINDGTNQYAYDAEGRVCAVYNVYGGFTQYLYDAEGRRVGKATLGSQTLPLTSAACSPSAAGLTVTASYLLGLSGRQVSELDGAGNFQRSQVYANGQLLASYTNSGTHFALSDWLGTKRVVANADGSVAGTCLSLPYGDELICSGDASQSGHHFTGKVHDQESGNDYFGARYYSSNMGRFMSPDPFGGHYTDPQTLNKYAYVRNNPLRFTDPTGYDLQEACTDKGPDCGKSHWWNRERHVGTTDDNGHFHVTHFQTDSSGSLAGHDVSFNTSGIHIDGNKGEFLAGTDPTRVNGESGTPWANTHFDAVDNCGGTCEARGTLFFGKPMSQNDLANFNLKGPNGGLDSLGDHSGLQFRGGNVEGPDMHLSFGTGQPYDPMHFDNRYPYGSVSGFMDHAAGWLDPAGHSPDPKPIDITPVPQP